MTAIKKGATLCGHQVDGPITLQVVSGAIQFGARVPEVAEEALEELARSERAPGVVLDTGTGDDFAAARALYRSLGYVDKGGVYIGGWSDPDHPGVNLVDTLSMWLKVF